jgi:tetratricopeptide (TPR) repeat protein
MLNQEQLDAIWNFAEPEESEARFRVELVDGAWDAGERAELQTQLARTLGLQDRVDEAETVLAAIEADEESVVGIRLLLERGRLLNSSGREAEAVPVFTDAAALAERLGQDFLHIDALHMLGIADADNAEGWAAAAIPIAEASTNPRTQRWLIALHNNLGWNRFDAGQLDAALAAFTIAAEWADAVGTENQRQWAAEAIEECTAAIAARTV